MKKSELRLMIRKIVREEVALSIKEVITEIVKPTKNVSKQQPKQKQHYSKNSVLNDVLNETAASEEWKTMGGGTYDSSKANEVLQSSYGDMMNSDDSGPQEVVVDGVNGDAPGMDFLKKDYRKLLKATEEKAKQKRG